MDSGAIRCPAQRPAEVGLAELFLRAHEIADITLPVPPAASGLWRILYLIAARITGLGDLDAIDGWAVEARPPPGARRGPVRPGAVERYFTAHADRFDLFGPARPWLQDPRLAAECAENTGVNKLVMGRATGNNLVWLSHHTDLAPRPVRAAEAAWYLLAWLYYGPSGKITARTVSGRTESNMTAGPLRSRISFHPLGRNLLRVAGHRHPVPEPVRAGDGPTGPRAVGRQTTCQTRSALPPTRAGSPAR